MSTSLIITLTINNPKSTVYLNPSLQGLREIQLLNFIYEKSNIVKFDETQTIFRIVDGKTTETAIEIPSGWYSIGDLQSLVRRLNKGVDFVSVNGDWYFTSKINAKLTKELYTKLGVPEYPVADRYYTLLWKNYPPFYIYCDIIDYHSSYSTFKTDKLNSFDLSPSHLLAVVPSENFPSLSINQTNTSTLNSLNLLILNTDGSMPNLGMGKFVISLKLS